MPFSVVQFKYSIFLYKLITTKLKIAKNETNYFFKEVGEFFKKP